MQTTDFAVPGRLLLYVTVVTFVIRLACAGKRYDHHVMGTSLAWSDPYDASAVIHSRFQVTNDGRIFVLSPRFRPGVPFTLGTFRVTSASRAVVEPEVFPLPSTPETHRAVSSSTGATNSTQLSLVNVIDLYLDDTQDVLWLLDVGLVDTMTCNPKRLAPAKIVRLEVDDDDDGGGRNQRYKTFEITMDTNDRPPASSCLQYIVMFRSRAANGGHYAFISDAGRSSVVVINTDTGIQWLIEFPERVSQDVPRDIMFLVTLQTIDGRSALYTTFLSGCQLFMVDLEHIDQCTATSGRPAIVEVGRKPYRITVLGTDTGSQMYFRRPTENEIWLWDANNAFCLANFVLLSKGQDCRAPVHVTLGYGGFVFVLKNNFADYVRHTTGSMGAYTIIKPVVVLPSPTTAVNQTTSVDICR